MYVLASQTQPIESSPEKLQKSEVFHYHRSSNHHPSTLSMALATTMCINRHKQRAVRCFLVFSSKSTIPPSILINVPAKRTILAQTNCSFFVIYLGNKQANWRTWLTGNGRWRSCMNQASNNEGMYVFCPTNNNPRGEIFNATIKTNG